MRVQLIWLACLAGCSSPHPAPPSPSCAQGPDPGDGGAAIDVHGTIGGVDYNGHDAVAIGPLYSIGIASPSGQVSSEDRFDIAVGDVALDCGQAPWSGPPPPGSHGILRLGLSEGGDGADAHFGIPVTFTVGRGLTQSGCETSWAEGAEGIAELGLFCSGEGCDPPQATDGWVEIVSLNPVAGVFDLTFGSDRLAGRFQARSCQ